MQFPRKILVVNHTQKHQTRTQSLFTGFKANVVWIKWSAWGSYGKRPKKLSDAIFPSTLPMTSDIVSMCMDFDNDQPGDNCIS